jgi:DNA helicase-2/ATP-dependent DNA helicase PcrA
LAREEIAVTTRSLLEQAVPKLADTLNFRDFTTRSFAWLDGMQENASDAGDDFTEYADEKTTWNDLISEISAQYGADQVTLHLLLQELDMRSKAPKPPAGAVPCFTIHGSKGMEFGYVYLIGMVEDQLPSWAAVKKGDRSREMQEERRNCFVAITRTEEALTLTYSDSVQGWSKRPSRFLKEMGLIAA